LKCGITFIVSNRFNHLDRIYVITRRLRVMDDKEEGKCMHYTQDDEGEYATRLTHVPQYTKLQDHRYRTKR